VYKDLVTTSRTPRKFTSRDNETAAPRAMAPTDRSSLDGAMRRGDYRSVTGKLSITLRVDPATDGGSSRENSDAVTELTHKAWAEGMDG